MEHCNRGNRMTKYKISVSEDCIGCAACISVCDNFRMNDKNKAEPIKRIISLIGLIECNKEASDLCPVQAIKIEEIK